MGILGFGKKGPSADDQTILTSKAGSPIKLADAEMLCHALQPLPFKKAITPDEDLQSLSVPRTQLRERILKDDKFRKMLRELPVTFQDVHAKSMSLSPHMSANEYVSDTKYNKLKHQAGKTLISYDVRMSWLEDKLGDWGHVKIPAAILLMMVVFVGWGAWRLGSYITKVVQEYGDATMAAATSDAGLERAIKNRSGMKTAAAPVAPVKVVDMETATLPPVPPEVVHHP